MSNLCIMCGRKNSFWRGDSFKLSDDRIICCDCADSLLTKINELWRAETDEMFKVQKNDIITLVQENYPNDIMEDVVNKVESIYQCRRDYFEQKKQFAGPSQDKIDAHILTTGYNLEGYIIKKYIKVVNGEVVLGTGFLSEMSASFADFFGEETQGFNKKIEQAREAALEKMIIKSIQLGGNAIIGVDYDYITFRNNMIGVIVNGTCVYVEKNNEL